MGGKFRHLRAYIHVYAPNIYRPYIHTRGILYLGVQIKGKGPRTFLTGPNVPNPMGL